MRVRGAVPPPCLATVAVLFRILRCIVAAAAVVGIGLAMPASGGTQPSNTLTPGDGERFEQKLISILRHEATEATEVRFTQLPEKEISAFLMFQGASKLPIGLTEPTLRIEEAQLVSAEAVVDLNVIRQQRVRSWLDPLQYFAGRLRVTASGTVRSGNGEARVEIESVTVSGIPVPVQVLQELVRHYTRTADHPDGTQLGDPIPLPYGITELRLSPGLAVIVQ